MRKVLSFNQDWLYAGGKLPADAPSEAFVAVTLPHTNVELPYKDFDDAEYQFISTYRKRFRLPEERAGRRVYLDFDGAMIAATITINGHTFPEHRGGYTPFSFDITDYLDETGDNVLLVHLDSTERPDIPPFGGTVDYLTFGGIYRDVWLRYVEPVHISNVRVRTPGVLNGSPSVEVDLWLQNQGDSDEDVAVSVEAGGKTAAEAKAVPAGGSSQITVELDGADFALWTPDNPQLYNCTISLSRDRGANPFDMYETRFGVRHAEFRDDGFYLNGERLFLRGLNRHQTFPYIGAAAPSRLQRRDADIVRYELGCNVVRTSHYPQSPYFLDRCDEIGLLVFEEIPGWQYIGDEDWKSLSLRDVRAMIERDWNHPSIILWGVRINESWDDHDFYKRTNELAHELDPTRQTGGVRFFQGSEFLEDVYTLNDFSNGVQEPQDTPHLITEFNGHMFPTKTYDHDARRVEHAHRHARIQDRALGMGGVSGAIGWCAFDYNTHKEFGSGDRLCHHGVMDIFRLPKYAAYAYATQVPPSERPIVHIASNWRMGDVNEGFIEPLTVLSNCEEIEVFIGDTSQGRFQPDRKNYPHLPHPPFRVTGLDVQLPMPYGDLHAVGYVNGEAVAEHSVANDGVPHALALVADDGSIHADGADMTRLVMRVVDRYGNPLRYASTVVSLIADGPADLVGQNPFPLVGGEAAVYLRSRHLHGTVTVTAQAVRLGDVTVRVDLV